MAENSGLLNRVVAAIRAVFSPAVDDPARTTEVLPASTRSPADYGSLGRYYYDQTKVEQTRLARYRDYDSMDEHSSELSSALDVYADNAVYADEQPFATFEVATEDEDAKKFLEDVIGRTNLREDVWTQARDLVKYGDDFVEVIFDGSNDLVRVKSLDRFTTFRNEDQYGRLLKPAFFQAEHEVAPPDAQFDEAQVVHYRLRRSRASRYGMSMFHSARRLYKQLALMEDGMVITRLSRAMQRNAFTVDVGSLVGKDAVNYVNEVKALFKKRRYLDPATGQLNVQDSPMSAEDDIWLPQGANGKSDVKVLQGQWSLGQIQDVEYFRDKLFAAIKVPKAYLGIEGETRARAVIAEQDVQFARSVRRVQMALKDGHKQALDRALIVKGLWPVAYAVVFPPISTIDELREWQVERIKADVAKIWGKEINEVSTRYILRRFLGMSDKEIDDMAAEARPAPLAKGGADPVPSEHEGPWKLPPPVPPPGSAADEEALDRLRTSVETLRDLVGMERDGRRWSLARKGGANGGGRRRPLPAPDE